MYMHAHISVFLSPFFCLSLSLCSRHVQDKQRLADESRYWIISSSHGQYCGYPKDARRFEEFPKAVTIGP